MKTLLLMRHAKSDRSRIDLSDIARPLNKRGRRAADAMAAYLRAKDLVPDLALVSSARRTQETWERMASTLGDPPADRRPDLYLAEPEAILGAIRSAGNFSRVLLLGHNPGIERAAVMLAASHPSAQGSAALSGLQAKFPTGAVAIFGYPDIPWSEVRFGRGELLDFVTPARIAK